MNPNLDHCILDKMTVLEIPWHVTSPGDRRGTTEASPIAD